MVEVAEFFKFSNPLFLDAFVAVVLYSLCRALARFGFPRISEGIREASLVFIVFMCYDASRYFALDEEATAKENGRKVIRFEEDIHINIEKPMQNFAVEHEDFAKFLNNFYLGAHWGGLVIFFIWAYARVIFASHNKMQRRRQEYTQFRGRFILMNMLAACSFMAYPCAPPRVFPEMGFKDLLLQVGHTDVYTKTRRWVNPYAAMPSMHQGYSLLFAVTIVIMLRSEILASRVEIAEEDEEDLEAGKLENPTGIRAVIQQVQARYNAYHVLSPATRGDAKKLFWISLLPFAFLIYPIFMFVVIVATGNHFVLDAIAGACAMGLAAAIYPLALRVILLVKATVLSASKSLMACVSESMFGVKQDIELGDVAKEKESEEKKGFLDDRPSEAL